METQNNNISNELILIPQVTPALLNFNYDFLEKELILKTDSYKKLIVTQDTLKGCKSAKKELAELRTQIENFRKATKKEAEKPIKEFEAKCKKLVAYVEEAEKPLNAAIAEFDEKTKEEKRDFARECIKTSVETYGLRPEYAVKMELKDEYANLSGTKKAVKESIDKQAELLKKEQDAYDSNVDVIKTTVEQENRRLKVKLKSEKFTGLLNNVSISEIISLIKEQADDIYEQENPKQEIAVDVTSLFTPIPGVSGQDNIEKDHASEDLKEDVPAVPDFFIAPAGLDVTQEMVPPVGILPDCNPQPAVQVSAPEKWECVFKVTGDFTNLRKLNDYLKENKIDFEVISQTMIN